MKFRKLAAAFMTAVLATASLAACGNDEEEKETKKSTGSFKESVEEGIKLSSEEKLIFEGKLDLSFEGMNISSDDETFASELFGDGNVELAVTFSGKTDGENSQANVGIEMGKLKSDFLEVLQADGKLFVNVETLLDGVIDVMEFIADEEASSDDVEEFKKTLLSKGKYIELTEELISKSAELFDTDLSAIGNGSISSAVSPEDAEKTAEVVKYLFELIDKGVKKGDKSAYSNDGDEYKLTINNKNINGVVSGLASVVSSKSEEIVNKLGELLGGSEVLENMGLDAETLQTTAELLKTYDVASMIDDVDFEVQLSSKCKDGAWDLGMSVSLEKNDTEKVTMAMDYSVKKADDVSIKAPTDIIPEEDVETLIDSLTYYIPTDGDDEEPDDDLTDDDTDSESSYQTVDKIEKDDTGAVSTKGVSSKLSDTQVYFEGAVLTVGKSTINEVIATGYDLGEEDKTADDIIESGDDDYYYNWDAECTVWGRK